MAAHPVKRLAALLLALSLVGLSGPDALQAQSALGAPASVSATGAANSLTVTWSPPASNGGTTITAYDVRHILTSAADKADANWTLEAGAWMTGGGTLEHVITGLRDSTGYDVQVRAINANGEGPWSTPSTLGTTTDHGGTSATATVLAPGASGDGSIATAGDTDVFAITVTAGTELWLYTTGELDTKGTLRDSSSMDVATNGDGLLPPQPRNFLIQALLGTAGTYFVTVEAASATATGSYTLWAATAATPGSTSSTALSVAPGSLTAARLGTGGTHYYRVQLDSPTDLWVLADSGSDLTGELLNSSQNRVTQNTDSLLRGGNEKSFSLRSSVSAGTYYVKVTGADTATTGPYVLYVGAVTGPGSTAATAAPLVLGAPSPGRIDSGGNEDHFSLTLEKATYVRLEGHRHGSTLRLTPTLYDAMGVELPIYFLNDAGWPQVDGKSLGFWAQERLPAGAYSIRVTAGAGQSGAYLLHPTIDTAAHALDAECQALAPGSTISDPLYGCQWHLNNTNQFGPGAGFDINVEEAWDTTLGQGINVLVADTEFDYLHPDLRGYEYESSDPTDTSQGRLDLTGKGVRNATATSHGSSVAGVITGRANDVGGRGVAPRATVYVVAIGRLEGILQSHTIASHMASVSAVVNNSWRISHPGFVLAATPEWTAAVEAGITTGYGGKGVFYVWITHNRHAQGSHATGDEKLNHHSSTVVCGIDYNDVRAAYSELGSNLWVCAPTRDANNSLPGILTTERGNTYNRHFTGTSASGPIVSGVAALVRAANQALTWRDVKLILAGTARKNDATNTGWSAGARKYGATSDTERYGYNREYGFGAVDAGAAVTAALSWPLLPTFRQLSVTESTATALPDAPTTGDGTTATVSLTVPAHIDFVEWIEVYPTLSHASYVDLRVELQSPTGVTSLLLPPQPNPQRDPRFLTRVSNRKFRLGASRHLGEDSAGTWTLSLTDTANGYGGTLHSVTITVYGHGYAPDAPAATSATTAANAVTVAWTAPQDIGGSAITSYDARRIRSGATDKSDANWTVVTGIWTSGDLEGSVGGLDDGVAYDIQIRAVNGAGGGRWSETIEGATAAVPAAPGAPRLTPRDSGLGLEWTAPASDGGAPVESYDARTILTSSTAEQKADDANWTVHTGIWTSVPGGDLGANVAELTNGSSYDVQIRAVNAADAGPWSVTRTRIPAVVNRDPSFPATESGARTAAEDLAVGGNVGAAVTATDPDRGDTLTYSIAGGHSLFDIVATSGQLRVKSALDYETATSHTFIVQVSDTLDSSDDADPMIDDEVEVTVTITDVNEPPTIEGDAAITKPENFSGTLDTYTATDPEATVSAFSWSLGGADRGDFTIGATTGELSFASPPDFDRPADADRNNVYLVTVQASDGVATGTFPVTVTVTAVDEPPVITGLASVTDFPENSATTRVLARYSATDPEGTSVSWSALSGGDANAFSLDSDGDLTFKTSPNFEDQERYAVTINAYDGSLTGSLDVTVTLKDVNEPPAIRGPVTASFSENATGTVASYSAIDPDANATFTWSLAGADRSLLSIAGGVVTFVNPPDFERKSRYLVTVRVNDGANTVSRALDVAIVNVNEPPVVTGTFTPSVVENSTGTVATYAARDPDAGATITWSLHGADAGDFAISNAGALAFQSAPNHEAQDSHTLTVRASDGTNNVDNTVTVTVTDVDETETLSLSSNQPRIGIDYTATISKGDDLQSTTWEWERSTTGAGSWAAIATATSATYRPVGDDRDYYLRVTASYNDGHSAKTLRAISGNPTGPDRSTNTAPVFPDPLFSGGVTGLAVDENSSGNTAVGTVPAATDAQNDKVTYSMTVAGFTTGPPFEINQTTRVITVASGAALNHELRETYSVTVTATDEFHAKDDATFDITIGDVNEMPSAVPDRPSTNEGEAVTFSVLANDSDPDDGDTLTVRITRQPASGKGTVSVNSTTQAVTYTPPDSDFNGDVAFAYAVSDGRLSATASVTVTVHPVNDAPVFSESAPTRSILEGAREGDAAGNRVTATDADRDAVEYSLSGAGDFVIDDATGQISVAGGVTIDRERTATYTPSVTADDGNGGTSTVTVTINVTDVNEAPTASNDDATVAEDGSVNIDVLANDSDPEDSGLRVTVEEPPSSGRATVESDGTITYRPNKDFAGQDTFTYVASDGELEDDASVTVAVTAVNDDPAFTEPAPARSVYVDASAGDLVGAPVAATDVDSATLTYSLSGAGAPSFEIDSAGQITVASGATFDAGARSPLTVTVTDGDGGRASIVVTITVATRRVLPPINFGGGGGGGGGGASGPSPSSVDFEWTVKRDIDPLDDGNDTPTGMWSDGALFWLLDNAEGAGDAVYAYDIDSGERVEEREFPLNERNRAPRGIWSDGETVWVSDSGRDRLFAYDLASGDRLDERDIELHEDNGDARGIWSDGETMWVLDDRGDALFAYDIESGALLGTYALGSASGAPQDLWSDGVTIWISDHGEKALVAYRLPAVGTEEAPVEANLEHVRDEDFTELSSASNNSPRGIWSIGDVMYVVDESDDKIYSYNLPDAIDARLASLTLSGIDIGEFDPGQTEYEGAIAGGVTETVVTAEATQRRTTIVIEPADAGEEAEGHQIALDGVAAITVAVTSADGARTRTYRVAFAGAVTELALNPTWTSVAWPGAGGVSVADALREGGIFDSVLAIYEWDEASQTWRVHFPGRDDIPGLNTLTTFEREGAYWIAVTDPLTWTLATHSTEAP